MKRELVPLFSLRRPRAKRRGAEGRRDGGVSERTSDWVGG